MNDVSKEQRVREVVRTVVHRFDPYNLLKHGAPEDEFDREIAAVVKQVPRIHSANDAAHALSRVLGGSFDPGMFTPESCRSYGQDLFQALKAERLI